MEATPAGAGEGATSGGTPFSFEVSLDLSHGYNRAVDSRFDVFAGSSAVPMPIAACAYPGSFGESEIAEIAAHTYAQDHRLRWQMSMDDWWPGDEGRYELYVDWEGRYFEHGGFAYYFIENAHAWVRFQEPAHGWQLYVSATFDRPNFAGGIANVRCDFHVRETDHGGAVKRDTHRSFRIHADGHRERA